MKFRATHRILKHRLEFDEVTAPTWLISANTVVGSTMDMRWFWRDHVLQLPVGGCVETDFHTIERIA